MVWLVLSSIVTAVIGLLAWGAERRRGYPPSTSAQPHDQWRVARDADVARARSIGQAGTSGYGGGGDGGGDGG